MKDKIIFKNLDMTVRLFNCFYRHNILYLDQFTEYSEKDLLKIKGFGKGSLMELKNLLGKYNLKLKKIKMNTDEIKVNILQVASELAELDLIAEFNNTYKEKNEKEIDDLIWIEEDEILIYTEKAQDKFNEYYDFYYSFLENLAIKSQ